MPECPQIMILNIAAKTQTIHSLRYSKFSRSLNGN